MNFLKKLKNRKVERLKISLNGMDKIEVKEIKTLVEKALSKLVN